MKSVNYPLRKAYVSALAGIEIEGQPVPVYYLVAPDSETSPYYITLNSVSNNDISTKGSSDTNTSMQVQIHTWSNGGNSGAVADIIAQAVYEQIYFNTQTVLDLSADNLQMISTKMANDQVNELSGLGNKQFVTRIITFDHNIYHKN